MLNQLQIKKMEKKLGIAIVAYNRPHYLYVTLDSLSRVAGIDKYSIYCFFDNINKSMRILQDEVMCNFRVENAFFSDEKLGVLWNVTLTYDRMFGKGYDEVLLFEDDVIHCTDMLQFVENVKRDAFFYNLMSKVEAVEVIYRAFGNLLEKKNFLLLYDWLRKEKYIGRPNFRETAILHKNSGHDAIYARFLKDHEFKTHFSDKFYVAHIGLGGSHSKASARDQIEIFQRIFTIGERRNWLKNAIREIESDFPKSLESIFKPRGFKYN